MEFFITRILNPRNYFFSLYGAYHIFVCLITIVVILRLLKRENFSYISQMFAFLGTAVVLWLLGNSVMFSSNEQDVLKWWARIQNTGVIFLPSTLFLLVATIFNKWYQFRIISFISIGISAVFAFLALKTDSFFTGFYHFSWGYYCRYFSLATTLYLLFFGILGIGMILIFYTESRNVLSKKLRNRYYLIWSLLLISFIGTVDFLLTYGLSSFPPIGGVSTFISICGAFIFFNRYELTEVSAGFAAKEIIHTMNDILILFDRDGIIQFVNASALKFFQIPQEEFIGKHILQVIEDPQFSKDYYDIMKTGSWQEYDVFFKNKQEQERILSLSFLTIRNGLQQLLAIVCMAQDTTDEKKAEDLLNKASAIPLAIIESLPIGIIVTDKDKKVQQINKAALQLMELPSEKEILHKPYMTKTPPGKTEVASQEKQNKTQAREEILVTPQEKNIFILKTSVAASINNKDVFLDVLLNIDDRKKLEKRLQKHKVYLEKLVAEKTQNLEKANLDLSEKITGREKTEKDLRHSIEDLETFHRITNDRNNKLIELKKEANQLALKLGRPQKYTL